MTQARSPGRRSRPRPPELSALDPEALGRLMADWGEPPFRARQVFQALHGRGLVDPAGMTHLPRGLRRRLRTDLRAPATTPIEERTSADGTRKVLLGLADGRRVESVTIFEGSRRTVCVSTQVGCPVGCVFCASGVGGLVRNLRTGEIVEQVLRERARLARRPSHVVVMGMGEPLLNLRRLAEAIRLWRHPEGLGFSARRITVSTATSGDLVDRLLEADLGVNLAVSLHGPDDETRSRLVPTSGPGGVEDLVDAAARYARRTGRDATVEYVLIAGENDRPEHARALAARLRGRHLHVNLIPLNPVSHRPDLGAPGGVAARAFRRRLLDGGVSATLRSRRGEDIQAACGQLALERAASPPAPPKGGDPDDPAG